MRSLLLLLLPLALSAGPNPADELIGRWRSTDVSGTGVSAVFEFGKDNELDSYSAAILEGRYRLLGSDTIVLRSKEGGRKNWNSNGILRIARGSRTRRLERQSTWRAREKVRTPKIRWWASGARRATGTATAIRPAPSFSPMAGICGSSSSARNAAAIRCVARASVSKFRIAPWLKATLV